jgi:hypothetical protein
MGYQGLLWHIGIGSLFCTVFLSINSLRLAAATLELQPLPLGGLQQGRCPAKVVVQQSGEPYQEGSFAWNGTAALGAIATQVKVAKVDPFSVTWVGILKPPFQGCRASAGIVKVDSQKFSTHSYLRMQFLNGKVYFILDMTGLEDPNGLTMAILRHETVKDNPHWRWGGTD